MTQPNKDSQTPLWEITQATEPVAFLGLVPEQLNANLVFRDAFDDLDVLRVGTLAGLADSTGVALVSYPYSPSPGTLVCLDPLESRVAEHILYVLDFLNLTFDAVTWIDPIHADDVRSLQMHATYFTLSARMRTYLADAELPTGTQPDLTNVFVYPDLSQIDIEGGPGSIVSSKTLLNLPRSTRRLVFLSGAEHSGKTTLLKMLFQHFYSQHFVPIIVTPNTVRRGAASEGIQRTFGLEYSRRLYSDYLTLPTQRRVIFFDRFTDLSDRVREEYLSLALEMSLAVVVVADNFLLMEEEFAHFKDSDRYSIVPMNQRLRNVFIRRWLQTSPKLTRGDLSIEWARAKKTIDTVVGYNSATDQSFVPAYPIVLLSILRAQEQGTAIGAGAAPSALGFFYELLIKLSLAQRTSTAETYDVFASFLAHAAFWFCKNKKRAASLEEMLALLTEFENKYAIKHRDRLIAELVDRRLLKCVTERQEERYGFQYPYIYYYFVAAYLRDHVDDEHCRDVIRYMAQNMREPENAHILLFLAHVSRSAILQSSLLAAAEEVFPNYASATLDKARFATVSSERFVYVDRGPTAGQDAMADALDKREGHPRRLIDQRDVIELQKALRTLRVVGQVLRNFPASLERQQKVALGQACLGIAKRTLQFLLDRLDQNAGRLLEQFLEVVKYYHPDFPDGEAQRRAVQALQRMEEIFAYSIIKRLAFAIGSPDLPLVWGEMIGRGRRHTIDDLFSMAIELDRTRHVSDEDIRAVAKRSRKNTVGMSVLRRLVTLRFDLFDDDYRTKQRVCALLDIEYRPAVPGRSVNTDDLLIDPD